MLASVYRVGPWINLPERMERSKHHTVVFFDIQREKCVLALRFLFNHPLARASSFAKNLVTRNQSSRRQQQGDAEKCRDNLVGTPSPHI